MAPARPRLLLCLLVSARSQLEDAEAMVQWSAVQVPNRLAPLGEEDHKPKGSFFKTLALGAKLADGDNTMAGMFSGMGDIMDRMAPAAEQAPAAAALDGSQNDPLNKLADGLQTFGTKAQDWIDNSKQNPQAMKDVAKGVGKVVSNMLPPEVRQMGVQLRQVAQTAKQGFQGAAKAITNLELSTTEDQKKEMVKTFSAFVQEAAKNGNKHGRDAQNIKKVLKWFRKEKAESEELSKLPAPNPWAKVNEQVAKFNSMVKGEKWKKPEEAPTTPAEEAPAQALPQPQPQALPQAPVQALPQPQPQAFPQAPAQPQVRPQALPQPSGVSPWAVAPRPQQWPSAAAAQSNIGYPSYPMGYPSYPMQQQQPLPSYPMQQQMR